ncbi:RHS repeat domain-containing protein [Bacteroides sp. 214]|uniref:RHS repeat domain-containing protein n=1 Tax=Bacteroides sp. 214 TaxID=2302935 RepID=UPI0013D30F75|nr:RHS repeat-associated core domain-containing protein [Bacteroides sp. 214]
MGYNTYTYAADGRKLKVVHRWDSNRWVTPMIGEDPLDQTKTTEYVGPIVYEKINNANPVRKRVLFDGGYIDEQGLYTYYLSDHLGNVQLVLDCEERRVQFNDYYPFGLPFAESHSTIQGEQPYKYNGKELDMLHGLNWYDYGNRMMAPDLPILTTPDRFAEKYYSKSPYVYVANNPVKYVDVNGDSIAILNYGTGTDQHLALLIQNKNGNWQYYSLNGDKIYNKTGGLLGGGPTNDVGDREFSSPKEFMSSLFNTDTEDKDNSNGYGFSEAYVLPTTTEQDETVRETFMSAVDDGYNLFNNQCSQAVQKSLNAAGIETREVNFVFDIQTNVGRVQKTNPYIPSNAFKAIIKNNPNGTYIKE